MLKIGLTGGIGSGKSTVASIFEVLGIPVYYADDEAKKLMNEDPHLKTAVKQLLGEKSYLDGKLDRSYIASFIFSDPEKLSALNKIIHPAAIANASAWMQQIKKPYAIKEAALIFESESNKYLDYVIGVFTPEEKRIESVMKRDGISRSQVLERMNKQMNEEEKLKRCDFVLINDENKLLIPQVNALHEYFLRTASQKISGFD